MDSPTVMTGTFRQIAASLIRRLLRPTALTVAIVTMVMSGLWLAAEQRNRMFHAQQMRIDVIGDLTLLRARLEGEVAGSVQLIRGLIATLITEPDMTQARFAEIAKGLIGENSAIRNVAAAPDMIIRMVYPLAENEAALGLNYRGAAACRGAGARYGRAGLCRSRRPCSGRHGFHRPLSGDHPQPRGRPVLGPCLNRDQ